MKWLTMFSKILKRPKTSIESTVFERNKLDIFQLKIEHEIIRTSVLFDNIFYSKIANIDTDEIAIAHYCEIGWRLGLDPSPYFSTKYYLTEYKDVALRGHNPLVHYIISGWREGRTPVPNFQRDVAVAMCPNFNYELIDSYLVSLARQNRNVLPPQDQTFLHSKDSTSAQQLELVSNTRLSNCPFVSIIVPSRDGSLHLKYLFESLSIQTYRNFEVILVDDGSTDDTDVVSDFYPFVKKIRAAEKGAPSVGYSAANNIGLSVARGELIAIQNNDTRVDPRWLEILVNNIRLCPNAGAIAPKIRFWSLFQRFHISSSIYFEIDLNEILSQHEYKKIFVRKGTLQNDRILAIQDGVTYFLVIDVPHQDSDIVFPFISFVPSDIVVSVGLDASVANQLQYSKVSDENIVTSPGTMDSAFHIINNAGSLNFGKDNPGDRGIGEIDEGQYLYSTDIEYLCGCSALIRRDVLAGRDLFIEDFIAYYEDSELSYRIRKAGFTIKYCDSAIVYHRHSASNIEFSHFWIVQTFRNKYMFKYIVAPEDLRHEVRIEFEDELTRRIADASGNTNQNEANFSVLQREKFLRSSSRQIMDRVDSRFYDRRSRLRIGIFNEYWSTMGGGEAHALDIARALAEFGKIELISKSDFNIDRICRYFDAPPEIFIKRLVYGLTPDVTSEYDIFVNASYQNYTPSKASRSLYIVSFPSRTPISDEFANSYIFLANSHYTQSWMKKYWDQSKIQSHVVYPCVADSFFSTQPTYKKENVILSVGRFSSEGHVKNQIEIVEAFRRWASVDEKAAEWRLILIGSVNSKEYVSRLRELSAGLPVEIICDAPFATVCSAYAAASIYVHASGYGVDAAHQPELLEHFGIAVSQAGASGCIPIVFDAGGPSEIITQLGVGRRFCTVNELSERFIELTNMDELQRAQLSEEIVKQSNIFRRKFLMENVMDIIKKGSSRSDML